MKLDKETIVKHQFWFLLGSYLLVWSIAMLWLKVAAGGPIADAQSKYKAANDTLTSAKQNPINTSKVLPPWNKQANDFDGWKSKIWAKAWELQGSMFDWPDYLSKAKDMATPLTELTPDERTHYQHNLYKAEIDQLRDYIPRLLSPIELQDGFDNVFQPMEWTTIPTREEMWLVQEDYWVKRELFFVVWKVMAEQAFMPAVPIDEKKEPLSDKGVKARYRYRNQNWELTLNIRESKEGLVIGGDSTIKNVHPSRRTQTLTSATGEGIVFNLSQNPRQPPTRFMVRGEPVPPGKARALGVNADNEREDYGILDGIDWSATESPVYVSQAFDVTNCPIRRINEIALTKQDCRTFTWPLQANQALVRLDAQPDDPNAKKPEAATGAGARGAGGMRGAGMGGAGIGGAPMAGAGISGAPQAGPALPGVGGDMGGGRGSRRRGRGRGASRGAASADSRTPNNEIERNRYLAPPTPSKGAGNPPSRHLPFAIQLVVEQSHLHDVKVALANSKLRIEITQVEFHHAKDFTPQGKDDKKGTPAQAGRAGMFMAPGMPNMGGRKPSRPGRGGQGPMPGMPGSGGRGGRNGRSPGQMIGGPPMMPSPGGAGNRPGMPIAMLRGRGNSPLIGANTDLKPASKPQDDNLVEVTIYGVAALYRRPDPPKKQNEQSPSQRGGRRQPGAGQPNGTPQPVATPPNGNQPPAGKPATPEKPVPPAGKQPDPKPDAKKPTTPKDEKR